MSRWHIALLVGGLFVAVTLVVQAQSGVPSEVAAYRTFTKMNAAALTDPTNPRASPKNTFVNLSQDQLRAIVGTGGRARQPFPDGTVIVRESVHPTEGWVQVLFVMRKDSKAAATKGWVFNGFSRQAADKPFTPIEIANPLTRCFFCHTQMNASDFVFTPFVNRPDPMPDRIPDRSSHVEILNYQFAPRDLRVKVGSTIVWANFDSVPHDIKATDKSFESGNLPIQGRYFLTVTKPGSTEYFCAIHLEMRGRIIVEQ
jgi:plastocyanin